VASISTSAGFKRAKPSASAVLPLRIIADPSKRRRKLGANRCHLDGRTPYVNPNYHGRFGHGLRILYLQMRAGIKPLD
jgi:hypothetical protein